MSKLRVLVADHDPNACALLARRLKRVDVEALECLNVADIVPWLMREPLGAVILGEAAEKDERERVVARIRQFWSQAELPVIVVGVGYRDEQKRALLGAGANAALESFFDLEGILDALQQEGAATRCPDAEAHAAPSGAHQGSPINACAISSLELGRALARGEIDLHYQPQSQLTNGRVSGAEALLRWTCPTRGLLPPEKLSKRLSRAGPLSL